MKTDRIVLGHAGENGVTDITFELNPDYLDAEITLLNKRNKDPAAYPVLPENYSVSDGVLHWIVSSGDSGVQGFGEVQIVYSKDDKILKTDIFPTITLAALDDAIDAPQPWTSWQQKIESQVESCEASAETASEAAEAAENLNVQTAEMLEQLETILVAANTAVSAKDDAVQAKEDTESIKDNVQTLYDNITDWIRYEGHALIIGS